MSVSRWQSVKRIFDAALDVPADERDRFVREACGGDGDLESDVRRLLAADERAGSFLERPALSTLSAHTRQPTSHLLADGSIVANRFQIIHFIGQGGMGQVYEALDLELNSRIALKAIRPEIAADSSMLSRFRREVQLTRIITHPNVCRTFDIERHSYEPGADAGNLIFLTMELLKGETLSARLRRTGRLPPSEVMPLVLQMVDALVAAHSVGVIHRDFKPSNVMLVETFARSSSSPSPGSARSRYPLRVVVTDFGLARVGGTHALDEAHESGPVASSITGDQALMGTLVYMAPEQFERGEASVASDIYSLGLVVFEMITGQRPFADVIPFAEATKRLKQPAPSAATMVPDLDSTWDATISRCLALDPKERYENVREVAETLTGSGGGATKPLVLKARAIHVHVWTRIANLAALFLVVVSLFLVGLRLYKSKAESKVDPGALIYLAPVKNETGEKAFDAVTELIRSGLDQSSQVALVDQNREGNVLQLMKRSPGDVIDPQSAREIAMRAGAVRVVLPTVSGSAGNYELKLDVQRPDTTPSRYREQWSKGFAWHSPDVSNSGASIPAELLVAVRNAGDWVRFLAGESRNDIARLDVPPEDATTSSWAALADFAQARKLAKDHPQDAESLLDRAVHSDPEFALAYAMRADILFALHRQAEGRQCYNKALEASLHFRLSRREQDRIRGMRAVDAGEDEIAIDAFHDLTLNYPEALEGWTYPTGPLRSLNRDEEAIANLRHAITLAPKDEFAPYVLAQELLIVGRSDEAQDWVSHLRQHDYPESAADIESIILFLDHRYSEARRAILAICNSPKPDRRNAGFMFLASLDAETGNAKAAIDDLTQGMEKDREISDQEQYASSVLSKAYLECRLGQYDACLADEHSAFISSPTPNHAVAAAAALDVALNERAHRPRVQRELQQIVDQEARDDFGRASELARLRTQGELQLAEQHPGEALKTMETLAAKDDPVGPRDYLGRALLAVAATKRNKQEADALLQRAQKSYAAVALHPALVRCRLETTPPGGYADQLEEYLKISRLLGDSSTAVQRANKDLGQLRN